MIKIIKEAQVRSEEDNRNLRETVAGIIGEIRGRGDAALKEYNEKFDGCTRESLRVSREEIDAAYKELGEQELADLKAAHHNIEAFANAQRQTVKPLDNFSPEPGVFLGHRIIPVESCCCYVPGGNYPLYSTALMLATPAKAAGVKRITACSPVVRGTGHINARTLVAMDLAGVDEIYALGGAQAIAAFSYGTESIKPVDIIVGPGNRFVTEAKRQCYGQVGIDFVAGPSEVLVIADGKASAKVVAADLLAQSEHDVNAKGILLTTDEAFGKSVIEANEAKIAAEHLAAAKDLAKHLEDKSITLSIKAGEGGKAFGSVSSKEIAKAIKDQLNLDIDKKKLVLPEPIKTFGTHEVPIKLHKEVTGKLAVKVVEA